MKADEPPIERGLKDGEIFRPYRKFKEYLLIPKALARRKGFSPGAKLVYGILIKFAGKSGDCFPSMKAIADDLGITERWAREHVGELVKGGLLQKQRGGRGRSNRYEFIWRDWLNQPDRNDPSDQDETPTDVDRNDPSDVDRNDPSGSYGTILPTKRINEKDQVKRNDLDYPLRGPEFLRSNEAAFKELKELVTRMFREPYREDLKRIVAVTPNQDPNEALEAIRVAEYQGYGPDHKKAPRSISWFVSVVTEHFEQKARRCSPPCARPLDADEDEAEQSTIRLSPQQDGWFNEFWGLYWRKEQKWKAKIAFGRQITSEGLWEGCKAHMSRDEEAMLNRDVEFQPLAATYLNSEDFLDPIEDWD
jgi:hypothetical protein